MRLKITRRLAGSIDGLQLTHFVPDQVYEVGTSLGSYLLAVGAAVPASDDVPARIVPFPRPRRRTEWLGARPPSGVAADQAGYKSRGKRKPADASSADGA